MNKIRLWPRACRAVLMLVAGLTVLGCDDPTSSVHRVNSLGEAGSYHVSVVATIPFDQAVRTKLKPNFDLSAANAKAAVVPTTTFVEERLLDAFTGAIGAGLGTFTQAGTRTVTETAGVQTTSGTSTQTNTPGTPPTVPTPPAGISAEARKDATMTTSSENKRAVAKDPILEYNLATALYQEVKLLELYVDHIEKRFGTKPYILRLNVSLQPHARNQPYDAYVSMGFFYPRDFSSTESVPLVVPLFVTDNLEGARTNRVAQVITQLSAALSGSVGNAGILGSLGITRDRFNSSLGTDLNSLLTVSRISDNTIRVRLGAPLQGSTRFAMVPRNHTVSVLVMPSAEASSLVIHTKTSLRDVESGIVVPADVPGQYAEARKVIARLFRDSPLALATLSQQSTIDALMRAIQTNNTQVFTKTINEVYGRDYPFWRSLWIALSETSASSEFQSVQVNLLSDMPFTDSDGGTVRPTIRPYLRVAAPDSTTPAAAPPQPRSRE